MSIHFLYLCGSVAFALPFLAIAVILAHYLLRRAVWKRNKQLGRKNLGFCPSSAALGAVFLLMSVLYRPSLAFVAEARLQKEVEENDAGDPEAAADQLNRQLKRIRRGQPVDALVLRL